ncbi:uncharacterized protein UDID_17059 [Ustilago sp. UG-2017a]|nr:uncharacterized protein UDID_17059 [Ustilago sp. UG-2017a]
MGEIRTLSPPSPHPPLISLTLTTSHPTSIIPCLHDRIIFPGTPPPLVTVQSAPSPPSSPHRLWVVDGTHFISTRTTVDFTHLTPPEGKPLFLSALRPCIAISLAFLLPSFTRKPTLPASISCP